MRSGQQQLNVCGVPMQRMPVAAPLQLPNAMAASVARCKPSLLPACCRVISEDATPVLAWQHAALGTSSWLNQGCQAPSRPSTGEPRRWCHLTVLTMLITAQLRV